ncbi:MAG: hypothetical protein D4R65_15900 [Verrucomicrobiaceae bacterium]|nr:MAG: hypothetical protein D4R65_15900 [Verrucomicrobiaceae bacterium]
MAQANRRADSPWARAFSMRGFLLAGILLSAPCLFPCGASAQSETLSGWVGSHRLSMQTRPVATSTVFPVVPAQAEFIAITEVHPESVEPVPFHYLVTGPGIAPFERRYAALGFGPVTYFLRVSGQPAGPVTLTNLDPGKSVPHILEVRGVTGDELARIKRSDTFRLMGTVINPQLGIGEEEQVKRIAEQLATDPKRGIAAAFSCEIYYASKDTSKVRQQLETARQRSRLSGLPVLLGMVSWWNGTPRNVPDGKGGKFDALQYQQICYTPDAVHPENAELRTLLGDRYNPHYCLTTPNVWSNTPWLTMNSLQLNAYRARRLSEAVDLIKKVSKGDTSWIAGIFLENEPRYWDTQSTQGTPQWCGERWADFNPYTVAAASRDGVTLNPADGLSSEELAWLQRNAGRYFQETVDAFRQALTSHGLRDRFPIYTHSIQLNILFPGVKINQSPSDWARASGAHTGLECIWSQPSDFDRVREWGPWCNLNREETDGKPADTHLWDLRTAYAMGAEFFNSYNWHTLKDDAFFRYARDFITGLPSVVLPPVDARQTTPDTITFAPPDSLQAFTSILVPVEAKQVTEGMTVALSIDGGPHRTWYSERQPLPADGRQLMTFDFPVPGEISAPAVGTLRLHAYDANGKDLPKAAGFANDAAQELRLTFDLDRLRTLSRIVIQRHQAAPR